MTTILDRPWRHPRWASRAVLAGMLAFAVAALTTPAAMAREMPESFAPMVKELLPAVVGIATTQTVEPERRVAPMIPEGSPLEDFFRDFFGGQLPQGQPRQVSALGSGFIISPDGYVVTNNHVVGEADQIMVILDDDRRLEAEIVGTDPATDLALLKVEADAPLPHVEWGDSDATAIGDWVVAIGNPFGLGGTVTVGVLSGRARDINAGPYDNFLQTDAPINQGNSGGPLFDRTGKVIGVNTVILSPSGGNIGIGFAIPASTAKPIIEQLRTRGTVERGWIGVTIQPVTDGAAEALGLERTRGALIAEVVPGGPAEKAGLKAGDVLLSFDGKPVKSARDLPRLVANTEVGSTVEAELWREGRRKTVRITLAERPTEPQRASRGPGGPPGAPLGMSLAELTPDARATLGLSKETGGALVAEVAPGSPAARNGIRPGDVIVGVGQKSAESPQAVVSAIRRAKARGREHVLLRINRRGDHRFVTVPL